MTDVQLNIDSNGAGPSAVQRGLFVVVLGPDGSGKTTILESVKPELAQHFNSVDHHHWRPGLLPKLGRSRGSVTSGNAAGSAPPKKFSYGRIISHVRYSYYLLDFLLGYFIRIAPRVRRRGLVIVERWHHDSLMNPQRYGFKVPEKLLRLGHRLVPTPDLVIVLRGDPDRIHARKPELTVDEIQSQICSILRLVPLLPCSAHIRTDGALKSSTGEFVDKLLNIARAGHKRGDSWRAFPRFSGPKLWIHDSSNLAATRDLYTPRSRLARLVYNAATLLPAWLHSRRLQPCELALANRVKAWASETLAQHEPFSLDFYIGTPGPHQKLTARISSDRTVIGYCKAGPADNVGGLLDAEILSDQFAGSFGCKRPAVIASGTADGWSYLVTSPPAQASRAWPLVLRPAELDVLVNALPNVPVYKNAGYYIDRFAVNQASLTPGEQSVYRCCIDYLSDTFRNTGVLTAPAHGDFAPWNMRELDDGELFLFDWEYSDQHAPVLFDFIHRIFTVEWLIRKSGAKHIVSRLLSIPAIPEYRDLIEKAGIDGDDLPACLLLYMLGILSRKSLECDTPPALILECIRLILISVGHPMCRARVLVSAYACEPDEGSEPGVGWNWTQEIAQFADVWVITRSNNRESIEQALQQSPNPHLNFLYADLPAWMSRWKKKQRGVRTYYYLWQFAALARYREISRQVAFDVGHHVTFVNDWLWTFLALTKLPFVWGPIGSHPPLPLHLVPDLRHKVLEIVRRTIHNSMRLFDPLFWLSAARARVVVGINREVGKHIPIRMFARERFDIEPAIGIDPAETDDEHKDSGTFDVLFVGRFAPVKAAHLALESFGQLADNHTEARLLMVGRGPTETDLRNRVDRLGLADKIRIEGWMPREDVRQLMANADLFLFPSLEGGGLVVLEAMAAGLPVVCLDYGGPGTMINDTTGVRVSPGPEAAVIRDLAHAMGELLEDPATRNNLATAARKRALEEFSWEAKRHRSRQYYSNIMFGKIPLISNRLQN